jgi:hypothetical protein
MISGLNLKEDEISKINDLLLKSIKKIPQEKIQDINKKIEEFTSEKIDVSNVDVLNFINENFNPDLLNELLSKMTENQDLMRYIQDLVFDKMLE